MRVTAGDRQQIDGVDRERLDRHQRLAGARLAGVRHLDQVAHLVGGAEGLEADLPHVAALA